MALKQAVNNGPFNEVPQSFKLIKAPEPTPPEWLSEQEVVLLFSTEDLEFKRFLQLLLYTGARRNEVLGLNWNDIDLRRKQIVIRKQICKTGRQRQIPVNGELMTAFKNWHLDKTGNLFPNYTPDQHEVSSLVA